MKSISNDSAGLILKRFPHDKFSLLVSIPPVTKSMSSLKDLKVAAISFAIISYEAACPSVKFNAPSRPARMDLAPREMFDPATNLISPII